VRGEVCIMGLGGLTPLNVLYLDYKAFDSVPTKRLLEKHEMYGLNGKLLKCIQGFFVWTYNESGTERHFLGVTQTAEWCSAGLCARTPFIPALCE